MSDLLKQWRLSGRLLHGERTGLGSEILLALSLALGLAALVALDAFTNRIENTVARDSKSLLAADFQVQAWRPFDDKVEAAVKEYRQSQNLVEQSDFVSSGRFSSLPQAVTLAVRALAGKGYPFYGAWQTAPALKVEELRAGPPRVIVDASLRARGVRLGDELELGRVKFKVAAFLEAEPQTVASAFALGPRVILHRSWAEKTGLMDHGARVFRQLLIRSPLPTESFKKKFRATAPDPHWRLITPEHANRQAEKILVRIRGFLACVGLAALFLGGAGLFMIQRGQLLLRLPELLTLRCLGVKATPLRLAALRQALRPAFTGWILGAALGWVLEATLAHVASAHLGMSLASTRPLHAVGLAALVSVAVVALAVLLPLAEVLRVPVAGALREEQAQGQGFSRRDAAFTFLTAALLSWGVSQQLRLTVFFLLGLVLSLVAIGGVARIFSRGLFQTLAQRAQSLGLRQGSLSFLRHRARSELLTMCLGLGLFLLLTILFMGQALRHQLDLGKRGGVPNLFVLGVAPTQLEALRKLLPAFEAVPITQARLTELKGKSIAESEIPEEDAERFYQTREYVITRRPPGLAPGERRLEGADDLFGPPESGLLRASIEERFAGQMGLHLGDHFQLQIAGITLPAVVRSLRSVDWFNFRPNFFLVFAEDDLRDAPMDFVAFARVPASEIASWQNRLAEKFPEMSALDGEALAQRLRVLLQQLSFSVFSVSLFCLGSCLFVFLGATVARKPLLLREAALWRCLGIRARALNQIWAVEALCLGLVAALSAVLVAVGASFAFCRWVLVIPFEPPPVSWILAALFSLPLLLAALVVVLQYPLFRKSAAQLWREAEGA